MDSADIVDEVEPLQVARDARELRRILDAAAGVVVVDRLRQLLERIARVKLADELAHCPLVPSTKCMFSGMISRIVSLK